MTDLPEYGCYFDPIRDMWVACTADGRPLASLTAAEARQFDHPYDVAVEIRKRVRQAINRQTDDMSYLAWI